MATLDRITLQQIDRLSKKKETMLLRFKLGIPREVACKIVLEKELLENKTLQQIRTIDTHKEEIAFYGEKINDIYCEILKLPSYDHHVTVGGGDAKGQWKKLKPRLLAIYAEAERQIRDAVRELWK